MSLFHPSDDTSLAGETSVTLFKRGSKTAAHAAADPVDEEKGHTSDTKSAIENDEAHREKALAAQPKMRDFFSWKSVNYTVTLSNGEDRRLLDDISGYVVPGKLTALMGESGAGKVRDWPISYLMKRLIFSNRPLCSTFSQNERAQASSVASVLSTDRLCHTTSKRKRATYSSWTLTWRRAPSAKRSCSRLSYASLDQSPWRKRKHSTCNSRPNLVALFTITLQC